MRRYLLDTGPVAGYLLGRTWAVKLLDPWLDRREVATSILVYWEVVEYLKGLPDFSTRRKQLRRQLQEIRPYVPTYPIMECYADIRRSLRPPHGPGLIGDIDTLIAATALEHSFTLVTVDQDFKRVSDLHVMVVSPKS